MISLTQDEVKATVRQLARVPDREGLPRLPALCPIFPRAGQPEPGGRRRGDITSRGIQFRQLCGDIRIDSLGGDEQLRGDLGVGVNSYGSCSS